MSKKNYMDSLFNPDDVTGVKMFGVDGWNRLKGSLAGYISAAIDNPAAIMQRPARVTGYNGLFTSLFRPDYKAGAELLGASWVDNVSNFLSSKTFSVASDIGHNVANIASYVPVVGEYVKGGRKVTNMATDVLNALGFGTKVDNTVKTAAIGGGALLLIGGGVAIWYFGFHKKKRGRR